MGCDLLKDLPMSVSRAHRGHNNLSDYGQGGSCTVTYHDCISREIPPSLIRLGGVFSWYTIVLGNWDAAAMSVVTKLPLGKLACMSVFGSSLCNCLRAAAAVRTPPCVVDCVDFHAPFLRWNVSSFLKRREETPKTTTTAGMLLAARHTSVKTNLDQLSCAGVDNPWTTAQEGFY